MPKFDPLREPLDHGDWDRVVVLLNGMDAQVAGDALQGLPAESQKQLFAKLPVDTAAKIAGVLPYFEAYVLLHSRPLEEMRDIVDRMDSGERLRFFDELPEEAWQQMTDEMGAERTGEIEHAHALPAKPEPLPVLPLIEARQVEKRYARAGGGSTQVIAPTDLTVESGLITSMLGPSGSGKSTLLRMLSGLSEPSSGEVLWHGKPLRESDGGGPNCAIVFQSFALFPWLTVVENVEVPLVARGMRVRERRRKAIKALDSVGLRGFASAYPKELSGGMKQRVGLARALAVQPEVLFMDEPFSALDVLTAENLRGELMELWLSRKMPAKSIFLVTHNIEEAVMLADRILVLGRNPARIRADFRIQIKHPRDRNAPEFLVYVDYIYKLLTQPTLDAAHPPTMAGAKQAYQMIPHARIGSIGGLLELLNDRGGSDDLYRVADELRMELDDLLPIVEAAALLKFAKSARGDVEVTYEGKKFAEAEIHDRTRLFRDAALANVTLLQQMQSALMSKSDHTMPLEFFRDVLREHFAEDEMKLQIDTALNWGRSGDIFTYQPETDRLALFSAVIPAEADEVETS